ncbi:Glucan 1,3-beta-glucosidase [Madurella mycetomatis]|uniref:Glucan 1,3-beta-glucosidase n=1 Tax=Madurella mycetomatis TaxID=100816 RepID=A0A175VTF5_9PEZI|nr:Glucan 1,3-beta-glucosidase [Madurella mycetomatis]
MIRGRLATIVVAAICSAGVTASPTLRTIPEHDAHLHNLSLERRAANTSFWYANIDHTTANVRGFAPDLDGDWEYEVYKAVTPGDGASIQAAINSATNGATRHGQWFASQPRVVYIPPGEYVIHETIFMNTDTIIMGDAIDPPVLKAAAGFPGIGTLISGQDPTTGISGELSFAVGLKNIVLDTTSVPGGQPFVALWWGVAQAAHLQNVKIRMPPSVTVPATLECGLAANGIWYNGHQQAVFKSIYFYRNTIGMLIDGGSVISVIRPTFDTVGFGLVNPSGFPWIALIDAKSINSGVTLTTASWPSYLIENLSKDTMNSDVVRGPGDFVLPAQPHVSRLSFANTVDRNPTYGPITSPTSPRPAVLVNSDGRYPVIPAPNYASNPVSDFLNVKDPAQNGGRTVYGDNTRDESAALNAILQLAAATNKIAYFPFGKYRVESTLHIPPGSRVVGEAWATISGYGSYFKSEASPRPIVQVGMPGETGTAHIQDMRFTVGDVLPGAIIVQFNLAGNRPGDVGIWNSICTVGGTRGAADLTNTCRGANNPCQAAFLGLHFARTSSVYAENVWNWVADHVAENFDGGSNFAAGRGALVEATRGTWLHGLGSEHWWLYQLNLRQAENVMVSLLQSETNYDQGDNNPVTPPAPWTPDVQGWGTPGSSGAGLGGRDVYTYASASWAFFSGPGYQSCAGQFQCQRHMHFVKETPANLQAFGLCSKDAYATLRLANGTEIVTENGWTGSWQPGGGDVGRYTP